MNERRSRVERSARMGGVSLIRRVSQSKTLEKYGRCQNSTQQTFNHVACDAGEPHVEALELVVQALVLDAEEVE